MKKKFELEKDCTKECILYPKNTEIAYLKEEFPNSQIEIRLFTKGDTLLYFNGMELSDPEKFPAELSYIIINHPNGTWKNETSAAGIPIVPEQENHFEYDIVVQTNHIAHQFTSISKKVHFQNAKCIYSEMNYYLTQLKRLYIGETVLDFLSENFVRENKNIVSLDDKISNYLLARLDDYIVDGNMSLHFHQDEIETYGQIKELYERNCDNPNADEHTKMICDFLGSFMTARSIANFRKAVDKYFDTMLSTDTDYLIQDKSYEEVISYCTTK